MAILVIRNNANTSNVGDPVSIPDTAIPAIRIKYGGSTNAQTANNLLAHIKDLVRHEIEEAVVQQERDTHIANQQIAETAARAAYQTTWPL